MVKKVIVNVRNFLTITRTLLNPDDSNLGIALPHVFHIFHLLLQNPRNIDNMLENPPSYVSWLTPSVSIISLVWIFILIFLSINYNVFEYLFWRVPLFNPGTLIGCGMAGLVGVLGFKYLDWNMAVGLAVCLLGGCIGSGFFRFNEDPRDGQEMYREANRERVERANRLMLE